MEPILYVCPEIDTEIKNKLFCYLADRPLVYIPKYLVDMRINAQVDLTDTETILGDTIKQALWHLMHYESTIVVVGEKKDLSVFENPDALGDVKCEIVQLPKYLYKSCYIIMNELYTPVGINGKFRLVKHISNLLHIDPIRSV